MVDTAAETFDERDVIDSLISEVTGIIVEAERRATIKGFNCTLGGHNVESDLGWVNFKPKLDTHFVENVKNRIPAIGEIFLSRVNLGGIVRREGIK